MTGSSSDHPLLYRDLDRWDERKSPREPHMLRATIASFPWLTRADPSEVQLQCRDSPDCHRHWRDITRMGRASARTELTHGGERSKQRSAPSWASNAGRKAGSEPATAMYSIATWRVQCHSREKDTANVSFNRHLPCLPRISDETQHQSAPCGCPSEHSSYDM